jgi:hypothetical protein
VGGVLLPCGARVADEDADGALARRMSDVTRTMTATADFATPEVVPLFNRFEA